MTLKVEPLVNISPGFLLKEKSNDLKDLLEIGRKPAMETLKKATLQEK